MNRMQCILFSKAAMSKKYSLLSDLFVQKKGFLFFIVHNLSKNSIFDHKRTLKNE